MVLSREEKIDLVKSIAPAHKTKIKKHLKQHIQEGKGMSGDGLFSFLGSIGQSLLPIVKSVGLPILKDVLLPAAQGALQKKLGGGLTVAGGSLNVPGGALRLAGQRGRGRPKKNKK